MKYIIVLLLWPNLLLIAQKAKEDPDERWACKMGSYHHCHCPAMVARVEEEQRRNCYQEPTQKQVDACLVKVPDNCAIIQKPDDKDPRNTCKRSCSKARCRCWDGPACFGGEIVDRPIVRDERDMTKAECEALRLPHCEESK
jgi:hypothetical protein